MQREKLVSSSFSISLVCSCMQELSPKRKVDVLLLPHLHCHIIMPIEKEQKKPPAGLLNLPQLDLSTKSLQSPFASLCKRRLNPSSVFICPARQSCFNGAKDVLCHFSPGRQNCSGRWIQFSDMHVRRWLCECDLQLFIPAFVLIKTRWSEFGMYVFYLYAIAQFICDSLHRHLSNTNKIVI